MIKRPNPIYRVYSPMCTRHPGSIVISAVLGNSRIIWGPYHESPPCGGSRGPIITDIFFISLINSENACEPSQVHTLSMVNQIVPHCPPPAFAPKGTAYEKNLKI